MVIIFLKKRRIKESSDEIWIKTPGWLGTSNCNTDSVTGAMSKAQPSLFCRGMFQVNSELLSRPFQKMPHTPDGSCLEGISPPRGRFSDSTKALLSCREAQTSQMGIQTARSRHCPCCRDPQTLTPGPCAAAPQGWVMEINTKSLSCSSFNCSGVLPVSETQKHIFLSFVWVE